MTDKFDKFMKWSFLDDDCQRRLKKDTPEKIKDEVRKLDNDYFQRTGRHKMLVDY